ncbi:MAG: hypothetical protein BGO68_05100 [Candidatus Amoebophilus sp. 36-38]|nr:MAG: hypothetical protein BGO68_05100 [Candidatus Amoebophilus sp. 36-38]
MTQKYTVSAGMENRGYHANKLLSKIYISNQKLTKPIDPELVQKAIAHLQVYHDTPQQGTNRKAYTQPVEIALMLMKYYLTTETLVSALLYDMVLRNALQQDQIVEEFGSTIAKKMEILLSLHRANYVVEPTQIKEMIQTGNRDVLLITLLDQLYIMQNISTKPKWEQLEITLQSLKIFLPLAACMRLPRIENELQTLCKAIIIPELSGDRSSSLITDFDLAFFKL